MVRPAATQNLMRVVLATLAFLGSYCGTCTARQDDEISPRPSLLARPIDAIATRQPASIAPSPGTAASSLISTRRSATPVPPASCRRKSRNPTISFRSKIAGAWATPPGTDTATATRSSTITPSAPAAGLIRTTKMCSRVIIQSLASIRFSTSPPSPTSTLKDGRSRPRRRRSRARNGRFRETSSVGPTASSRSISSRSRLTCFTAMPPSSRSTGASS